MTMNSDNRFAGTSSRASRNALVAFGSLALAALTAACGGGDDASSVPALPGSTAAAETTPGAPVPPGPVTAEQAVEIALATSPGTVFDVDRDTEGGRQVWEVSIRQSNGQVMELDIDRATGQLLKQERTQPPSEAAPPSITAQQAIATARGAVPDGAVVDADLDSDDGMAVWEVLVRRANGSYVELDIDATSGAILKNEVAD